MIMLLMAVFIIIALWALMHSVEDEGHGFFEDEEEE